MWLMCELDFAPVAQTEEKMYHFQNTYCDTSFMGWSINDRLLECPGLWGVCLIPRYNTCIPTYTRNCFLWEGSKSKAKYRVQPHN